MKIALISDFLHVGGAEKMALMLFAGLREKGNEVKLFCDSYGIFEFDSNVEFTYPPDMPAWPQSRTQHRDRYVKFLRTLDDFKPDVVHVHNIHGGHWPLEMPFYLAAYYPVLWTAHDIWPVTGGCCLAEGCPSLQDGCAECSDDSGKRAVMRRYAGHRHYEKLEHLWSEGPRPVLIAPSEWMRQNILSSSIGRYTGDVELIYNSISDLPDMVKSAGAGDSRRRILILASNLDIANKGADEAVEILRDVAATHSISVTWAGKGASGYAEKCGAFCESLGVEFNSSEKFVRELFVQSDIFLLCSHIENFPTVVLEAMSSKCMVVARAVGGIPEMLSDGVTGMLFSGYESAVGTLKRALDMPQPEFDSMLDAALRDFKKRFHYSSYIDRHIAQYEKAAGCFKSSAQKIRIGLNCWNSFFDSRYELPFKLTVRGMRAASLDAKKKCRILMDAYIKSRFENLLLHTGGSADIALYGAGMHTAWLLRNFLNGNDKIRVKFIFDDKPCAGSMVGIPVFPASRLSEFEGCLNAVVPSSEIYEGAMIRRLSLLIPEHSECMVFSLYGDLPMKEILGILPPKEMS